MPSQYTEISYFEDASSDANAQAAYVTNAGYYGEAYITQDVYYPGADFPAWGATGTNQSEAQSFSLAAANLIYSVTLRLVKHGTPTDNLTVRIETDNAGAPSGTLADANATKTIASSSLTGAADNEFVFAAPPSLSGSQLLWIVINRSGARDTDNGWGLAGQTPSAYAGGNISINNSGTWSANADWDLTFIIKKAIHNLESYSESTIKTQGSYALKAVAAITGSLNKTLTKTFASPIDLTGINTLKLDMRSTRTGANVKLGLHDTGGTTTELTPTINSANEFETKTWDVSAVADADKNAIDKLIFTQVNADSATTTYVDNFYGFTALNDVFGWVDQPAIIDVFGVC